MISVAQKHGIGRTKTRYPVAQKHGIIGLEELKFSTAPNARQRGESGIHVDLLMIRHERALFSTICKAISL
jgi:hypothetical protein